MKENKAIFCECKSQNMERFLEACLLMGLYNEIGHGYGLIERLGSFGFSEPNLNMSTLYRTLRKMENEGLVKSLWEAGGQGPQRRVYEITVNGKNQLGRWIEIFEERKLRIESLIHQFNERKNIE